MNVGTNQYRLRVFALLSSALKLLHFRREVFAEHVVAKFDWRMVENRVIEVISALVKLFDPHLLSRSEERDFPAEAHWTVRKAFLFVAGISLVCGRWVM